MSDSSELARKAEGLSGELPPTEFVEKLGRAMIAQVPVLGALVTEFIPTSAQKRVTNFCMQVAEDIKQMSADVQNRVLTDDFAYLFTRCVKSATLEYREEKLKAYRSILSSNLRAPSDSDLEARFVDKLDSLTVAHLKLIRVIWVDGRDRWRFNPDFTTAVVLRGLDIMELLPDYTLPELFSLEQDLEVHGLVWKPLSLSGFSQLSDIDDSYLDVALSDFGIGFMAHITPDHPAPEFLKSRWK